MTSNRRRLRSTHRSLTGCLLFEAGLQSTAGKKTKLVSSSSSHSVYPVVYRFVSRQVTEFTEVNLNVKRLENSPINAKLIGRLAC